MPEDRLDQVLSRYSPLSASVDLSQAGGPLADYMYRVVTDPAEFEHFRADPAGRIREAGLDPSRIDVDRFGDLAKQLRDRFAGASGLPKVADSISQKETNEGQSSNWDHSSSWLMNKDGYNVLYDKGHDSYSDTSSEAGASKNFEGTGIRTPEEILRHEVNLLFFPAQPLVTPQLVNEIRDAVQRQQPG